MISEGASGLHALARFALGGRTCCVDLAVVVVSTELSCHGSGVAPDPGDENPSDLEIDAATATRRHELMALLLSRNDSLEPSANDLLETEIQSVGTHAIVALAGEIDLSTVGKLYEQFAALAREGVRRVSLNMAEVTFMDSTGVSVLVTEHKRMDVMNGELTIFSPSTELRRLFEISRLDSYFNIRPQSTL